MKKLSAVLFHLAWVGMVVSAIAVFVAMHRNLFGPSAENITLLRAAWNGIARAFGSSSGYYPPEEDWSLVLRLTPTIVGLGASYLFALFLLRYGEIGATVRLKTLLIIAVSVGLPLLIIPNLWSSDVFDYIIYGRLPAIYHVDPYISAVVEYPADPFYNMTSWKMAPSVYGPAWTVLSMALVGLCELLSASPGVYVFIFKSFSFACHVAAGAVIWRILDRAELKTRAFGTALYLFNPHALIEFAGNGHNESFVILMIALAIWMEQRGRWAFASIAFALAVQGKLYVLPMFCLYVAYAWWREPDQRRAFTSAAGVLGVFIAASLILYLPFGLKATTFFPHAGAPATSSMTKSLAHFIVFGSHSKLEALPLVGWYFSGGRQQDVQFAALLLTFFVCLGGAAYARTLSRLVTAMAFFAFWWSCAGATWFMPWYVTVAMALAPLSASPTVRWPVTLFSFTVFLIYLVEAGIYPASGTAAWRQWVGTYYQVLVFCPPLALAVILKGWNGLRALKRIGTLAPNRWERTV